MAEKSLVDTYRDILSKKEEPAPALEPLVPDPVAAPVVEPAPVAVDKAADPYEAILREQEEATQASTGETLRRAQERDAKTAADDVALGKRGGLDDGTVSRNRDELKPRDKAAAFLNSATGAPVTRAFVSDPVNAALAQNDGEALSIFEHVFRAADFEHDMWNAFGSGGVRMLGNSLEGFGEMYRTFTNTVFTRPMHAAISVVGGKDLADAIKEGQSGILPWYLSPEGVLKGAGGTVVQAADHIDPLAQGKRDGLLFEVLGGTGQVAANIAVALFSSGLSTLSLFAHGADMQAERAEAAGVDRDSAVADTAILGGGIVTAATERAQLKFLLKGLPLSTHKLVERLQLNRLFAFIPTRVADKIVQVIGGAGSEGAQEIVEGIGHNLIAMGLYDDTGTLLGGAMHEGKVAAIVGGVVGLAIPGRQRAVQRKKQNDILHETALEAEVTELSPDEAADFRVGVSNASGGQSVFVPSEEILKWAQAQDQGVVAALRTLGVEDQMAAAIQNGGEVEISGEVFASTVIQDENIYPALADHIRYEADGMSLKQAKDVTEIVPEMTEAVDAEIAELKAVEEPTAAQAEQLTRLERTKKAIQGFASGEDIDIADVMNETTKEVMAEVDRLANKALADQNSLDEVLLQGRIQEIDSRLEDLDRRIIQASDTVATRESEGKPTVRDQAKVNKLVAQRDKLEQEQADLALRAGITTEDVLATPVAPEVQAENESLNQELESLQAEREALVSRDPTLLEEATDETIAQTTDEGGSTAIPGREQLAALDAQIEAVQTALAANERQFDQKPGRKIVAVKADRLRALGVKASRQASRQVRAAFKAGARLARKDVKEAQTALIKLLRGSGLKPKDIAKFVNTIRDVQTAEQLQKRLPAIQARVLRLVEAQRKSDLKKALKKLLNRTKSKKAIPLGKFTPEISRVLGVLRAAMSLAPVEARERLKNIGGLVEKAGSQEDHGAASDPTNILENQILALVGDPDNVSANDLENTLLAISEVVIEGRAINKSNRLLAKFREDEHRDALREAIGPERNKPSTKGGRIIQKTIDKEATWFLGWSGGWWNKLQRIMTTSDAELANGVIDNLSLFKETRAFEAGKRQMIERWTGLMAEATGLSETELHKLLLASGSETVNLNDSRQMLHSDGVMRYISFTRAELRKRVMEMKNPQLWELAQNKKSNKYTPEILEAMELELTNKDRAIIAAQLEFYSEYYERINKAYEEAHGTSMPRIDFYSPISRAFEDGTVDEFLKGARYLGSTAPGSLKSRKPSLRPLRDRSDIEVLTSHIIEMEYFIAYHKKVSLINSVFYGNNAEIITLIEKNYGKRMAQTIRNDIEYFAKKGTMNSEIGAKGYLTLIRNFGAAQLFVKPQIALKQLASFAAFSDNVPSHLFIAGLLDFAKNPRAAMRVMKKSDYFANRGINIDKDFSDLADDQGGRLLNFLGRNPKMAKLMALNIRLGDKGAILVGGYAHVYAMKKQGKTTGQALSSFERISVRTQQSSDPDHISEAQRGSPFMRVMVQFMSSANALARAEYSAVVEASRGRITKKELAKRLVVYHLIIPNLIMIIANGFQWEGEDHARASLLGAFNGVLIFGELIEAALALALGQDYFEPDSRHVLSFVGEIYRAIDDVTENGLSWEDFVDGTTAIDSMTKGVGSLTGIPINTLSNMMRGLVKVGEGEETAGGAGLMLGYSPYVLEKNELLD